jgi:hypothetical protein
MPSRLSASSRTPWQGPRASVRHAKWLVAGCPAPVAIGRLAVVSLPLHLSHAYKPYAPGLPRTERGVESICMVELEESSDRAGTATGVVARRGGTDQTTVQPGFLPTRRGVCWTRARPPALPAAAPRRPRPVALFSRYNKKNYGVPAGGLVSSVSDLLLLNLIPDRGGAGGRERARAGSAPRPHAPAATLTARQGQATSGGRAEAATPRRGAAFVTFQSRAESPERARKDTTGRTGRPDA